MRNHRAATRYAKSILELAIDLKKEEKVHDDMQLLYSVIKGNRVLEVLLVNPIVTHEKKSAVLKALFKNHVDVLTMSAFDLITRKNRENILLMVAEEFGVQYNLFKGYQQANIVTTFGLDDDLKKEFEELVSKISNKQATLDSRIDKSILGGFVLTVGDKRIDNSVRSKLATIHRELTSS